jgi:L-asparaginase II
LNLLVRIATLLDRERAMSRSSHKPRTTHARQRRHLVVDAARRLSLLDGEQEWIDGSDLI